ncbi:hypothetical protein ACWDYJ_12145 [Streptomyces sp. NPDC003042]
MDARAVVTGSEVVVECPGVTDYYGRGTAVPLRLRRRVADGAWLFEVGTPVAAVPRLAGVARAQDVRAFARGMVDVLAAGSGEPDFTLFDDGRTEVIATAGYGPELYLGLEAAFDLQQDRVGTDADGRPLYANAFGGAHVHLGEISPAQPEVLAAFARALLAALDGG